jgi:RNA polymerase sigma-70 factor (ECF subfamily)
MTFESIYIEFDTRLRKFILGRVSDLAVTEDILQNVYLKIHSNIDSLRDSEKLESWIYQIARNAIIDHYRHARPEVDLSEYLSMSKDEETDVIADLAPSVHRMLETIPEKYRQALILTEIQGLTQAEMAAQLGITVSGAKSRVQRAREKLKEAYLECCHFEFDRMGKVIHYESICCRCASKPEVCN